MVLEVIYGDCKFNLVHHLTLQPGWPSTLSLETIKEKVLPLFHICKSIFSGKTHYYSAFTSPDWSLLTLSALKNH